MLRVITWNIAALPKLINPYTNPYTRLQEILDKIVSCNADVICLQEVFSYEIQKQINNYMSELGFHVFYSNSKGYLLPKNGLMTITRFCIEDTKEMDYNESLGVEKWVNKGVISTKINTPDFTDIWVHNTHTQSDTRFWIKTASEYKRDMQFSLLKDYLFSFDTTLDMQMLVGDLNDELHIIKSIFPFYSINKESINTFPKKNKQLDYVLINNDELDTLYYTIDCEEDRTSDHNILVCDIKIKK